MPRSVFLGRVVAPGEPLWTDEDRSWALALADVERDVCPDCGHPWSEASAPDSEWAYTAELLRCHACAAAHGPRTPTRTAAATCAASTSPSSRES
ncbi:hypothetical protein ACFQ60_22380 [Streptomyces zhihengii]